MVTQDGDGVWRAVTRDVSGVGQCEVTSGHPVGQAPLVRRLGLAASLLAVAACADDPPAAYTLDFTVAVEGAIVAAQDGDGPWQAVPIVDGVGSFAVTQGHHAFVSQCINIAAEQFDFPLYGRFEVGDPGAPRELCPRGSAVVSLTGAISSTSASVHVGYREQAARADGTYAVFLPPSTYDVVARDAGRMLIRRDVVVVDGQAQTPLDLDLAGGFDLVASAPLAITGAGTDDVGAFSELHSARETYVYLEGAPASIALVPAARRVPGDRLVAGVTASDGAVTRVVQHLVDDTTVPALALPPAPAIAADRDGAAWSGDWDWIGVSLRGTFGRTRLHLGFEGGWFEARGQGGAMPWIDADALPGDFWAMPDPGTSVDWSVWIETGDRAGELVGASATGSFTW